MCPISRGNYGYSLNSKNRFAFFVIVRPYYFAVVNSKIVLIVFMFRTTSDGVEQLMVTPMKQIDRMRFSSQIRKSRELAHNKLLINGSNTFCTTDNVRNTIFKIRVFCSLLNKFTNFTLVVSFSKTQSRLFLMVGPKNLIFIL